MPTDKCFSQHLGIWCVEPTWFSQALAMIRADTYPKAQGSGSGESESNLTITSDGLAVLSIEGPITKGGSSFGDASAIGLRRDMQALARDPNVKTIIPHIDSPGGNVAGIVELAREFAETNKIKPVLPHIDNLGASAAFWIASQGARITAGPTAEIGSIGTFAVVEDSSGLAEMEGIKVHVISTGKFKGEGIPGTQVTDEQLSTIQTRVDDINEHFLEAVSRGRNMTTGQVKALADGSVHIAEKALGLGLIDEVIMFDDVVTRETQALRGTRARQVQDQRVRQLALTRPRIS